MYMYVAKAKALLISCAQLICDSAFAYAKKKQRLSFVIDIQAAERMTKGFYHCSTYH